MPTLAEGWFLYAAGPEEQGRPGELVRETFELPDLEPDQILVEPLYGCWEANMSHAIERSPIDVVAAKQQDRAIIGNAGVARVLKVGSEVRHLREGQLGMMFGLILDRWGYTHLVMGYDAPLQGLLATRLVMRQDHLMPLPENTRHTPAQWAAFNNRYVTAWANWRVAYGTFRLLLSEEEYPTLNVWTWGGGTGLAEVQLAASLGHRAVAIASRDDRLALIRDHGVEPFDRRPFADLAWDEDAIRTDKARAARYFAAEKEFVRAVRERTDGDGVQIFVEMIGVPVFRATTRALSRHGILTTSGWKEGMDLTYARARETVLRHQFIHTHYCRRSEAEDAMAYGEEHGWMPIVDERVYGFDEVPELVRDYDAGDYRMFPIYSVNPE